MKKISRWARVVWNKRILSSFFSTMFLLTVSASMSIGATYDDFNAGTINSSLWNVNNEGVLSQSGGLLHFNTPPNSASGTIWSKYQLNGDFEVILDYRDFSSTATTFVGNYPHFGLQVSTGTGFVYINRAYRSSGNFFFSSLSGIGWCNETAATSASGQLKISRIGSTITTSYNQGTGWVTFCTLPSAFTDNVTMQIAAYVGDNGTFHVDSDGITYTGQLVATGGSSYDCLASAVAGLEMTLSCPTNVIAGSPLNVTVKLENWCCKFGTSVTISRFSPRVIGNAAGNVSGLGIYGPYQAYNTQTVPNATGGGCPDGSGDTPGTKTFSLSVLGAAPTALANTMATVDVVLLTGSTGIDITGGSCTVLVKP